MPYVTFRSIGEIYARFLRPSNNHVLPILERLIVLLGFLFCVYKTELFDVVLFDAVRVRCEWGFITPERISFVTFKACRFINNEAIVILGRKKKI